MTAPVTHAIDGGIFGHALCEEPTGDTATSERDVDCGECLDLIDALDFTDPTDETAARLTAAGWTP